MKKKSVILSFLLIVFLGLTLTACKTKTKSSVTTTKKTQSSSLTDSSKQSSSKDTTKSSSETVSKSNTQTITPTETKVQPVKLSAPVISLERSIITITGSDGATKFNVYVNNQLFEENLEARAYTLSNITRVGTYEVYVVALGDNETTLDSDKSNTISYVVQEPPVETIQLSAPVIALDGTLVTWTVKSHVVRYEVYINGELKDSNVTVGSYSLSSITEEGTYSIQVKAIGDGRIYSDSALSNAVTYTKTSTVTPVQLDAPVLTRNGETLSWNEIEDAESYQVYVNGEIAGTPTTNTQYQIPNILPAGTYVFKVKALGDGVNTLDSELSNEITYEVSEEYTFDELKVEGTLNKSTYIKGTDKELDLSGLTFIAIYSDGVQLPLDIDQDLNISPVDLTTVGEKKVTISFTDLDLGVTHSAEVTIRVIEKEVSSIEVSLAQSAKKVYDQGDTQLNLAGITITVVYNNDTQDPPIAVTQDIINHTSYDLSTPGTYDVIVSCMGKTKTFRITVNATVVVTSLSVTGSLVQDTFKYDHVLELNDLNGISVTANYSDNTHADLTLSLDMITYNFKKLGDTQITITYKNVSTSVNVTVINYVTGIQVVSNNNNKYNYSSGKTNMDFLAANTISKTMAYGEAVVLSAEEKATVSFTPITPGHREITFTFGEFTTKNEYDITYEITVGSEWTLVQSYLDGFFELKQDIVVEGWTNEVGLAPLYGVLEEGYYNFYIDGEGSGNAEHGQIGQAFTGKFDGKGYSIEVKIGHEGSVVESYGLALFGWIGEDAVVQNFTLVNSKISGWQRTSFIAARVDGHVENVLILASSVIVHNTDEGVSWTPEYGVFGLIGGSATIDEVICIQPTGKNGTKDVDIKFSINERIWGEVIYSYCGPNYPVEITQILNEVEVEQNQNVDLSTISLEVIYKDGSTGTLNPTRVSQHDKGAVGTQPMTFLIDTEAPVGTISIDGEITVLAAKKVLAATLKDNDTVALVPFVNNEWNINEVEWDTYINLTADGEAFSITSLNVSKQINESQNVVTLTISGTLFVKTEIDVPIAFEVNSKAALVKVGNYGTYIITEDIRCEDEVDLYLVINDSSKEFHGILDGQNHSISYISIRGDGCGFFGKLYGTIKNLKLYGSATASNNCGVVAYSNYGTIQNVYFEGILNSKNGGIVYYNAQEATISNCVIYGTIKCSQAVCHTNEGTIENVLAVYDESSTVTSTIYDNSVSTKVELVSKFEIEYNVAELSDSLWKFVLKTSKIVTNGIYLYTGNIYSLVDGKDDGLTILKKENLTTDSFIQVDLGEIKNVSTFYVLMGETNYLNNYELYYAEHLNNWIYVGEFNKACTIVTINSGIRYIKIVSKATGANTNEYIDFYEIGINKVAPSLTLTYENMTKYEESNISDAFDGDSSTYVRFNNLSSDENKPYVIFDLGSVKLVNSFAIEMAHEDHMADYFHQSTVYSSINGYDWIQLGDYTSSMIYKYDLEGMNIQYIKIEYTGTEANEGELVIREFMVNLDVILSGLKPNNVVHSGSPLSSVIYATDKDLDTSLDLVFETSNSLFLDLHEEKTINTITIVSNASWGSKIKGFKYAFSSNGVFFDALKEDCIEKEPGVFVVELETPVSTRYIQIDVIFSDGSTSAAITEISAEYLPPSGD